MKGLVDYTSSSDNDSEELDYDINQSKKRIKETPGSENKNSVCGKGVKRKAEDTLSDDIEIISYIDDDDDDDVVEGETNCKFFNNDVTPPIDAQKTFNDSKLHISLSRPLFLKYFQIERFWENLRKGFENKKR
ncbi:8426_t:CDS:2 [Racocetra fulgida]|uniref:8426_t:CDS:1 n=1 Tax=Racocetra fulgida TaxID=60492 RepID=A0A9N8VGF9_9GLOM|nr:8426_t:CDS:2 [Racocetra fulgida]